MIQETDDLFKQHSLSVSHFLAVKQAMNQIIIGRERSGKHSTKIAASDILSLADQLYQSKSTDPKGPEPGKLYFSKNPGPDLLMDGLNGLQIQTKAFNLSIQKNALLKEDMAEVAENGVYSKAKLAACLAKLALDDGANETVNDLFLSAQESSVWTTNLTKTVI